MYSSSPRDVEGACEGSDALKIISSAISGLIPAKFMYIDFERGYSFDFKISINSSSFVFNRSFFLSSSGRKYSLPGSTSLRELIFAEILFIESIILLFSSVNIIFECLPIISIYMRLWLRSPSSFKCSSSKQSILSRPI